MSTVPEAILANSAGMSVVGISCITNAAAHTGHAKLNHKEVVDIAAKAHPAIKALLTRFLEELEAHAFSATKHSKR
jgi:purine-nucleoside phosphorylase